MVARLDSLFFAVVSSNPEPATLSTFKPTDVALATSVMVSTITPPAVNSIVVPFICPPSTVASIILEDPCCKTPPKPSSYLASIKWVVKPSLYIIICSSPGTIRLINAVAAAASATVVEVTAMIDFPLSLLHESVVCGLRNVGYFEISYIY